MISVNIHCCYFARLVRIYWRWSPGGIHVTPLFYSRSSFIFNSSVTFCGGLSFRVALLLLLRVRDLRSFFVTYVPRFFPFFHWMNCVFGKAQFLSLSNSLLIAEVVQFTLLVSITFSSLWVFSYVGFVHVYIAWVFRTSFMVFDYFFLGCYFSVWAIFNVYLHLSSFSFQFIMNFFYISV